MPRGVPNVKNDIDIDNVVSRAEFSQLDATVSELVTYVAGGSLVQNIVDQIKASLPTPSPVSGSSVSLSKEEIDIVRAKADNVSVNPEWDRTAREVIGDEYVDHTEVHHLRDGGIHFTVVIKNEKSNMPSFYLDQVRCDRRTKEVGTTGIAGVTSWCKLIKSNLNRGKAL